jgi:hypothetical protein
MISSSSSVPNRRTLLSGVTRPRQTLPRMPMIATFLGFSLLFVISSCNSGSSGPPPRVTIAKVTDRGTIRTNSRILGRDGGSSALFQGYSVWLYGDTFLSDPDAEGRGLISDSWSYTTDLNAQDGITGFQERVDSTGAPTMILPESAAEQAFNAAHNGNPCQQQPCGARWALWPSAMVADNAANRALIFYMVVSAKPGSFNFQGIGNSVASWQNFQDQPQRPPLNPPVVADHPDLLFKEDEPNFGTTAFIQSGTLFVYGCGTPINGADKGCRLAKVPPASAEDRSAWMYYAGSGKWSASITDAVSAFTGGSISSVSWNDYLQSYVAVYSPPFSQDVNLRTSPNPEGPWSGEITAFTALQPAGGGNVYDALAHPEYNVGGGQTMFISYSRATGGFTSEVRLVALQLSKP